MAEDTDGINADQDNRMDTTLASGEDSVLTPQFGIGARRNDEKIIEKTIKFEFPIKPNHKENTQHIAMVHSLILHAIETSIPPGECTPFNNRGRKVQQINIVDMSNPITHQKQFKIHTTTKRAFIIHRIQTSYSLSAIRNQPAVFKILRQYNVFLRQHNFTEDIWDTIPTGFLIGIAPTFYTPEMAAKKLTQKVFSVNKKAKLPPFKMVFSSPYVKSPEDGRQFRTKAYTIEVNRSDGPTALRILKDTFRDQCQFVPMKMKYVNPPAYAKAIQQQTHYLNELYVIPLLGMTDDALMYIQEPIKAAPGVTDIAQTKNYMVSGRYNILVKKELFKETKAWLIQNFQKLYDQYVAEDAKPHPDAFSGPPRIASDYGDADSSGADSYMSMSAASFTSFNTSDIQDDYETPTHLRDSRLGPQNNTQHTQTSQSIRGNSIPMSTVRGHNHQYSQEPAHSSTRFHPLPPAIITRGSKPSSEPPQSSQSNYARNDKNHQQQANSIPRPASPVSELTRTDETSQPNTTTVIHQNYDPRVDDLKQELAVQSQLIRTLLEKLSELLPTATSPPPEAPASLKGDEEAHQQQTACANPSGNKSVRTSRSNKESGTTGASTTSTSLIPLPSTNDTNKIGIRASYASVTHNEANAKRQNTSTGSEGASNPQKRDFDTVENSEVNVSVPMDFL
jgi:hypothetical protein